MTLHQSLLLAHVPYFTPKTPAISLSCGDGSPEPSLCQAVVAGHPSGAETALQRLLRKRNLCSQNESKLCVESCRRTLRCEKLREIRLDGEGSGVSPRPEKVRVCGAYSLGGLGTTTGLPVKFTLIVWIQRYLPLTSLNKWESGMPFSPPKRQKTFTAPISSSTT